MKHQEKNILMFDNNEQYSSDIIEFRLYIWAQFFQTQNIRKLKLVSIIVYGQRPEFPGGSPMEP